MNYKVLTGQQKTFLDVFRITAALFVLIGHSFSFYGLTVFKDEEYFPYLQNIGVVMFFLLSGFLTAHSLSNKNRNNDYRLNEFAKSKIIRIMREYIPGLIMIAAIDFMSIQVNGTNYKYFESYTIKEFLGNIFMLQGTAIDYIIPGFDFVSFGSGRPLWTLSLEWWFYFLLAGFYLVIVNKEKIGWKKLFLLGVFIFMPIEYIIDGRGNGLGFVFGIGCAAYYCYDRISERIVTFFFVMSLIAYIAYGVVFKNAYTIMSFVILWCIFCFGVRVFAKKEQDKQIERNRIFMFLSRSTFMLYLIHYSVIDMIYNLTSWNTVFSKFVVGIVISLIIAMLMHYVCGMKLKLPNRNK